MSSTPPQADSADCECDVVVVGGGPAGCSAGVFLARYGLDTVVYDRGKSSLGRCAYLENYLGFPAGIDVETFYGLIHDHAERAGCDLVPDVVESVSRADGGDGFRVAPQSGEPVTTRRVVAATRYGGDYLRPLDEGGMFETIERRGETRKRFDREYAGHDGSTPVDGLYVASPSAESDRQAIVAAGRGARVGHAVLADVRRERGYPDEVAKHYDWVRREAERDDEWADRDRWREWFERRMQNDHGLSEDRFAELRERAIDRRIDSYRSDASIESLTERGHRRLLERLDDDLVLERAREIAGDVAPGEETD